MYNQRKNTPGDIIFQCYFHDLLYLQAADPVIRLMKEQAARSISHLSIARQNTINDLFKYTDKIVDILRQRCTCCKSRGFDDCPLQVRTDAPGNPSIALTIQHIALASRVF
jgi:hypothetical protein